MSQAQQAYSAAAATYTAVAGMRAAAYGAAAAAQPVAGYAAVAGWVFKLLDNVVKWQGLGSAILEVVK